MKQLSHAAETAGALQQGRSERFLSGAPQHSGLLCTLESLVVSSEQCTKLCSLPQLHPLHKDLCWRSTSALVFDSHCLCVLPFVCSFQRLVFTTAAKLFSSTYKVMVEGDGDAVGYLNPLLAMASVINVSLPGQQPDLRSATEDMRLFDSSLVDKSGRP